MIVGLSVALAGTGAVWIEPPAIVDGELHATFRSVTPVDGDALALYVGSTPVDATFEMLESAGSHTLVAVDDSGSFRRHYRTALDLIAPVFERASPKNPVGWMRFGRQVRFDGFRDDPQPLRNALEKARTEHPSQRETRLAASILRGIDTLIEARPPGRGGLRRLVLITDAGEESDVFDTRDIIDAARTGAVRIDVVAFTRDDARYADDLDRSLRLARATGGTLLEIHDDTPDPNMLRSLLERPSGFFLVRASICGDERPPLRLRGPGFQTEPVLPVGEVPPCTPEAPVEHHIPPQPARGPLNDALGLLCLATTIGGFTALLGLAAWLLRRPEARPAPSPTPPPPPDPPPTPTPPAPPSPHSPAFPMKLPETHLVVVGGDLPRGTRWRFSGRILRIGANPEDNDVVVDLPQVSGNHARFELYPSGAVFVEDRGSSNGTWIDGRKLPPGERTEVPEGATLALSSQLQVRVERGAARGPHGR